jgi:hypothetical protein
MTVPENVTFQIRNIVGDQNLGISEDISSEFSVNHDDDIDHQDDDIVHVVGGGDISNMETNNDEEVQFSQDDQVVEDPLLIMQMKHVDSQLFTNAEALSLKFYKYLHSLRSFSEWVNIHLQ